MSENRRNEFYEDGNENLKPEFTVDIEAKMSRQVCIEAEGVSDAEEKVMEMINDDELTFTNSDAVEISVTANEVIYPFRNLADNQSDSTDL